VLPAARRGGGVPACWSWLLLAGWILLAPVALARAPALYGEDFVRLGQSWPDAGAPVPGVAAAAVRGATQDDASYQRLLAELEEEGGPYAGTLAEPLADLARLHRRNGELLQAQQAYQRALHVVRVNEGLYSESQTPILKELFEVYRQMGDLQTLDARYDYYFRLYGNGRPPFTPARINADLEYLRWQREAVRLGLDKRDSGRLLRLYTINDDLLAAAASDPALDFASYRQLVLSQLRNLYLLESRYEPESESFGMGIKSSSLPSDFEEFDSSQRRLEMAQRNALPYGRQLLQALIDRTPAGEVEWLAGAWLELADWNQWNDHRDDALIGYAQVEKLLQEAGRSDLLQQWLGQPVELPANGAFWQPGAMSPAAEPIVVQARYAVSASGRAKDIETTAEAAADEVQAGRLRRDLAQTRFRPRILNGEPEEGVQLQRDYQLLD